MTVRLAPHDPAWAGMFRREADALSAALGETCVRIEHIGSTAVPGLIAKPVIDILIGVHDLDAVDRGSEALQALGFEAKGEYGLAGRRYFRKSDAQGERTHHLHIYRDDDPAMTRHLAFRDYLLAQPDLARAYGALKQALAEQGLSGAAYQSAKSDWVAAHEAEALDCRRRAFVPD